MLQKPAAMRRLTYFHSFILSILIWLPAAGANVNCGETLLARELSAKKILSRYFAQHPSQRDRSLEPEVLAYKQNMNGLESIGYEANRVFSGELIGIILKKGDRLLSKMGSALVLGEYLGAGIHNQIFALAESPDWVIAIPTAMAHKRWDETIGAHWDYYHGEKKARAAGYPLVEIQEWNGLILRKRLDPYFTIAKFFQAIALPKSESDLTPEEVAMVQSAVNFIEFLSHRNDSLGDLHDEQIAWDGHHWVIVDFGAYKASGVNSPTQARKNNLRAMRFYRRLRHLPSVRAIFGKKYPDALIDQDADRLWLGWL